MLKKSLTKMMIKIQMIMSWIAKSLKVEDHKSNLGKSIRNMYRKKDTILNMITGKMTGQDMSVVSVVEDEGVDVGVVAA